MLSETLSYKVLDLARWAPSGDNTQPWAFEITGPEEFLVCEDERYRDTVYDLEGRYAWMAIGALLENIAIAATGFHATADIRQICDAGNAMPKFKVRLVPDQGVACDRLQPFIRQRSVHRGILSTRHLSADEKRTLQNCMGDGYKVIWYEGIGPKWKVVRLLLKASQLRLTMPEAHATHRAVIEWKARFSETRIPDAALRVTWPTRAIMRWALQRWSRIEFLNRYLAGTWLPRVEMDLIPGMFCGAHFLLQAPTKPQTMEEVIRAGRAMQRFWLTATSLGLMVQPEFAPIIFGGYAEKGLRFSNTQSCLDLAVEVKDMLAALVHTAGADHGFFLGRIGAGQHYGARALRQDLDRKLIWPEAGQEPGKSRSLPG